MYNLTLTTITVLSSSTPYTLCDGVPRLDGYTRVSTTDTSYLVTQTSMVNSTVYAPIPAPSCSIGSRDCAVLNNFWWSNQYAFQSYESYQLYPASFPSVTPAPSPVEGQAPVCGIPTIPPNKVYELGPPVCAQDFATIRLIYWPVSTVSGDLCKGNGSTVTISATLPGSPNTFSTQNTTLTSPTVYMQVEGTWLYHGVATSQLVGQTLLMPQQPDAVSSYCGQIGGPPVKEPVNFANFNYPVPARAYMCQPRCFITNSASLSVYTAEIGDVTVRHSHDTYASENLCSTIWDDYIPVLSVPETFSTLTPQVNLGDNVTCQFIFDTNAVFFDPPIAIPYATSVDGPILTAGKYAITTTSSPSPSPEPAGAAVSGTPTATSHVLSTPVNGPSSYSRVVSDSDQSVSTGSTQPLSGFEGTAVTASAQPSSDKVTSAVSQSVTESSRPSHTYVPSTSTATRGIGDIIASALEMITVSSSDTVVTGSYSVSTTTREFGDIIASALGSASVSSSSDTLVTESDSVSTFDVGSGFTSSSIASTPTQTALRMSSSGMPTSVAGSTSHGSTSSSNSIMSPTSSLHGDSQTAGDRTTILVDPLSVAIISTGGTSEDAMGMLSSIDAASSQSVESSFVGVASAIASLLGSAHTSNVYTAFLVDPVSVTNPSGVSPTVQTTGVVSTRSQVSTFPQPTSGSSRHPYRQTKSASAAGNASSATASERTSTSATASVEETGGGTVAVSAATALQSTSASSAASCSASVAIIFACGITGLLILA